jgi:hypothetical protein
VPACHTLNGAPAWSRKAAIRPWYITSKGATSTLPPAASTRAAISSASSVATYVLQAVGWPSPYSGPAPAVARPSSRNVV